MADERVFPDWVQEVGIEEWLTDHARHGEVGMAALPITGPTTATYAFHCDCGRSLYAVFSKENKAPNFVEVGE